MIDTTEPVSVSEEASLWSLQEIDVSSETEFSGYSVMAGKGGEDSREDEDEVAEGARALVVADEEVRALELPERELDLETTDSEPLVASSSEGTSQGLWSSSLY